MPNSTTNRLSADPMYSVEQTAEYLGVTHRWVQYAVAHRMLPFHKVGKHVRFRKSDLDKYLAATRVEAVRR